MKTTDKRLRAVIISLTVICILLVVRLVYLQVWQYKKLSEMANIQIDRKEICPQFRGNIYDRNMNMVVTTLETESVYVNPKQIKNKTEFANKISRYIDLDRQQLLSKLSANSYFVWIKRLLSPVQLENIKQVNLNGIGFTREYKRYHIHNDVFAQLIGKCNIDGEPLSGIELLYNKELTKSKTIKMYRRFGKVDILDREKCDSSGFKNVVMTLDLNLQYIAYNELKSAVEKNRAKKGYVIIQNPNNGDILAMVSYPGYNPNDDICEKKELINPAINEIYEPGSTFKVVTTCALISEGLYKPSDVVFCENGSFKMLDDVEINDHEKRGYLTFEGILAYSSNIGFAKMGNKLGKEKLYYWVRNFGFGTLTGSCIPGEHRGLVPNPYERKWSGATTPTISFGQGLSVTGLQLINAYSSIANGGIMYEPQFIKKLVNKNNKVIWENKPKVIRRVITPEVSRKVISMLTKVIEYGTGKVASVNGYLCAGKTGTAQKTDPVTKKYSLSKYVASFCGFLPADNPQLVILVVIDEPQNSYWASDVACPVFSNIGKKSMNYLNIPKSVMEKEIASIK